MTFKKTASRFLAKYFHLSLFLICLLIYLVTRIVGIEDFPVYFFTDEAFFPVIGKELIKNGFKDSSGNLFPLLSQAHKVTPSLFVYLQMIGTFIFSNKIWVVRGVTVIISLIGGIFLSLTLKNIFKVKQYWIGILFLSSIPFFFLHSRTGFETVPATSFYAIGLYFYFQYRDGKILKLFLSLAFFALSFYTYFGVWLTIGLTAVFLSIIDIRFHLKNKRASFLGLVFGLLLLTPFFQFQLNHFAETMRSLEGYDGSLVRNSLTWNTALKFLQNYLESISPFTLFIYNPQSDGTYIVRHIMKWYGFFPVWSLPFIIIGFIKTIASLKTPFYRILTVVLLTASVGTFVGFGATRIMPLVIPLTIFFAIGVETLLKKLQEIYPFLHVKIAFTLGLFTLIAIFSIHMCFDSVQKGKYWFQEYGLYGLQYGAKQIFQKYIPDYLSRHKKDVILVSPNWSNGTEIFPKFFLDEEQEKRVKIKNVLDFILYKEDFNEETVFIITSDEFEKVQSSHKFKKIRVLGKIYYPNNKPGFFVVKLEYVDTIDEIMKKELEKRNELITENMQSPKGNKVKVSYSRLDAGVIKNIFDKDGQSLIRGFEANPFILELEFSKNISLSSFSLTLGTMNLFTIDTFVHKEKELNPLHQSTTFTRLPPDPKVTIPFKPLISKVKKLRIEIKYMQGQERTNIHVRELEIF